MHLKLYTAFKRNKTEPEIEMWLKRYMGNAQENTAAIIQARPYISCSDMNVLTDVSSVICTRLSMAFLQQILFSFLVEVESQIMCLPVVVVVALFISEFPLSLVARVLNRRKGRGISVFTL